MEPATATKQEVGWAAQLVQTLWRRKSLILLMAPHSFQNLIQTERRYQWLCGLKAWVCGHLPAEIVGLNPTGSMDGCLL